MFIEKMVIKVSLRTNTKVPGADPDYDGLMNFIQGVLVGKDHFVSESDLYRHGLDLPIVEAMFKDEIKPLLGTLHGFKPLGELPELNHEKTHDRVKALVKADATVRVVPVLDRNRLITGQPVSAIKVWLARSGDWYVWRAEHTTVRQRARSDVYADGLNETEVLDKVASIAEVCKIIQSIMFGDHKGLGYGNSAEFAKYPALIMEQELRELLGRTIESQEKHMAATKRALSDATNRTKIIRYY